MVGPMIESDTWLLARFRHGSQGRKRLVICVRALLRCHVPGRQRQATSEPYALLSKRSCKLTPTMSTGGTEQTPIARRLATVKHIILVLSGKGGVGKSSVSVQLALSLYTSSPAARVGILDVDLTGPSIPRMMGVDGRPVHQSVAGWVPVYADQEEGRMACMSVGFLLKRKEDSVVWRGPKKNAMIRQFLSDVRWGDLDYLVVDTPPG
jgi:Mrp family chromosome partitioning ATPase